MQVSQPSVTEMVRRLIDEGLVERDERKRLQFTPEGEKVAKHIVSRHRLIEAYLVSEFGIPWDEVHEEAHTFEHAISPKLEQLMYEKLPDVDGVPARPPDRRYAARDRARSWQPSLSARASSCCASRTRIPSCSACFKRTGVEPGDTIELLGLDGEACARHALGQTSCRSTRRSQSGVGQ